MNKKAVELHKRAMKLMNLSNSIDGVNDYSLERFNKFLNQIYEENLERYYVIELDPVYIRYKRKGFTHEHAAELIEIMKRIKKIKKENRGSYYMCKKNNEYVKLVNRRKQIYDEHRVYNAQC